MNLKILKESNRIIFECIAGSHLYNLSTPKSDFDVRGIYINPSTEYLGLNDPVNQIGDEKHDTTYYSLRRFFELAMKANPNILELAFVPENCFKICKPEMKKIIENGHLFVSKKCFHTFSGYAFAQVSKASGAEKMVNHPEMFEKPRRESFCYVVKSNNFMGHRHIDIASAIFPMRPMPLVQAGIDLSRFHVAGLEHVADTYRLYDYGSESKGVFRGNDMLVCESIPIDDEWDRFFGVLIYNKNEYEKALQQHRKYKEWIENRNEARWIDQENKKVNYDAKNMMHTLRLLMSGENILTNGFPLVRFEGEKRDYLMKIRNGEFKYEEIMAEVEKRMAKLEDLYKTSTIPHEVNQGKIEALYRGLSKV